VTGIFYEFPSPSSAPWLARFQGKHGFEKLVAIKTILPSFATDVEFRRMFLDEATIASRIEHTNVAQILDLGEHDGILSLVMEWVEGDSVSRLERAVQQAGSVVPQAIALRIASDSCAGLHAAHELCDDAGRSLGVVHRDVSPQNVLVSAKGVVKLIDFGIAKAKDRASEDTRSGVFKGKLHYMAPEQALAKGIDRRADVWAVAAMLYKLLARRPVHDARSRVDALRSLTSNEPLTPLPDHVPKQVAEVVSKALSFEPDLRYESCSELQKALDRAIHAESLYITTGELSAFVNQHLASQFEARRETIKSSMLALSEDTTLPKPQSLPSFAEHGESPDETSMDATRSASEWQDQFVQAEIAYPNITY
jgi:serine/threonine-protein kinase